MCYAPVPLKMEKMSTRLKAAYVHGSESGVINVPCGKCIECRRTYIDGWAFRLENELKASTTRTAKFITLTYNDDELYNPENNLITENGEFTLNYNHHRNYMQRLRRALPEAKIKYFTAGEYGERTDRPHFHSIIFNATEQEILNSWIHGSVHFGDVTENSIRYCLKYALKRVARVKKSDYVEKNTYRSPEKSLISKGLGIEYTTKPAIKKYYQNDIERAVTRENGKQQALPRYYREKFYTKAELSLRTSKAIASMEIKNSPEQLRHNQAKAVQNHRKEDARAKRAKMAGD